MYSPCLSNVRVDLSASGRHMRLPLHRFLFVVLAPAAIWGADAVARPESAGAVSLECIPVSNASGLSSACNSGQQWSRDVSLCLVGPSRWCGPRPQRYFAPASFNHLVAQKLRGAIVICTDATFCSVLGVVSVYSQLPFRKCVLVDIFWSHLLVCLCHAKKRVDHPAPRDRMSAAYMPLAYCILAIVMRFAGSWRFRAP